MAYRQEHPVRQASIQTHSSDPLWFKLLLLGFVLPAIALAQDTTVDLEAVEDRTAVVIVNNVTVLAQGGANPVVNLRVKNGSLDLITADPIPTQERDILVDATGGFLLGRLIIKEAPSFIVVDDDPRENIDALLDTKSHIMFAMAEGEVVRNRLAVAVELPEPVEASPIATVAKWFAYTPPPVAVPLTWDQGIKWNHWDNDKWMGIFAAALVLDRMHWVSQDADSQQQVGDLDDYDGGEIRGFRLGAVGAIKFERPWIYTIFGATNAFAKGFEQSRDVDDFALFDWRLDIPVWGSTTVAVGKQKEPISMERIISGAYLPGGIERSAPSDALMPSRNVGVTLSGNALEQNMTWAVGAFNDWFDAGQDFDESASQLVGRLTAVPFATKDESTLLHLGAGARWSDAKEGVRYRTEPEFNKAPLFVDTGPDMIAADQSLTWNFEATFMQGPYLLQAEYVTTDVDSVDFGDLRFHGYHVIGSWVVTGEKQTYNRRSAVLGRFPVAKGVDRGGWGAVQLSVRFSDLDLTDGLIEGGRTQIRSLGVNWWLSSDFYLGLFYRDITLSRGGVTGDSAGLMTRLGLVLE